eukprot:TRINITY_DN11243_c0_g1_i2.p1 TRINITY_DN11243_c0_g1~~TRINITY_DN11243_c0_g1_i2.p1  ORF type:complete len:380 (+),score=63.36 TRINITY_DN11243_c0_g1_i2:60-1142(+)
MASTVVAVVLAAAAAAAPSGLKEECEEAGLFGERDGADSCGVGGLGWPAAADDASSALLPDGSVFTSRLWEHRPHLLRRHVAHPRLLLRPGLKGIVEEGNGTRNGETGVVVRRARVGGVVQTVRWPTPSQHAGRGVDNLTWPFLQERLTEGFTVVLNRIETRTAVLRKLCANLEERLGVPTGANIYVTPRVTGRVSQGFDPHFDPHDVAVVQVSGSKKWSVEWPPPLPCLPRKDQDRRIVGFSDGHKEGPRRQTFVLTSGDVLYLPRGTVHAAEVSAGAAEHSVHVTFSFEASSRTFETLAHFCVRRAAETGAMNFDAPSEFNAEAAAHVMVRAAANACVCRGQRPDSGSACGCASVAGF